MARVVIVNMPFVNLRWAALGPSLLQAALLKRGIDCQQYYFNFDFAEAIGLDNYQWLADAFAFVAGGERLFARHYFPALPDDESYYREVLATVDCQLPRDEFADYLRVGAAVEPFLDHCERSVDWAECAVLGFSASFQQTLPALCLARRIKRRFPHIPIVFGGAACEGEMGEELLRSFAEVDYVFLGEADESFPDLAAQLLAGGPVRLPAGVLGRESPRAGSAAPPPVDLNALPYPNFDDYFARCRQSPFQTEMSPMLVFETSRGCWWGQKHHCKFCGLNGARIGFRSKAPQRAVDELAHLTARYGILPGSTSDNILDFRYFSSFLPLLKQAGLGFRFVIEMRASLDRQQVQQLLAAGLGAAQLGIETFSTPILKLIDKGTTAVQNLQTLKWFSEAGIEVKWNLLYGFPQEDPREYAALAELLPGLVHLVPPIATGRVRADRFSPYFEDPAAHGIANLRPHRTYRFIYPLPAAAVARLAYYYEHDYADGRNIADYVGPTLDAVRVWNELAGTVTLRYWDRPDGTLLLTDTRPCAAAFQQRLTDWERELYLYCDTARPLAKILEHLLANSTRPPDEAGLRRTLERLVCERLMVYLDDRFLSLALRAPSDVD